MLKFSEFVLKEGRSEDLPYTEKSVKGKLDKVIVELKGNQSGKFTKLAKRYQELKEATDELEKKQKEFNAEIKKEALDLFDAQDEVMTRVVETVSMTIQLSKKTEVTTSKVDIDAIIAGLSLLVPELTDQINVLVEANTKVSKSVRSPALKVALKEGILDNIKDWISGVFDSVMLWTKNFDRKKDKLQVQIDSL
jgi:hypothetical protein